MRKTKTTKNVVLSKYSYIIKRSKKREKCHSINRNEIVSKRGKGNDEKKKR